MRDVNQNEFIRICKSSETMSIAAQRLNMRFSTFKRYAQKFNCYNPNQGGRGTHKKSSKGYDLQDILNGKYPEYQSYKLRYKLIESGLKQNKCECCGISEWNGKSINMELHHIDGNSFNQSLDNLQMLCPNCHSQTDNFRAKNKKEIRS